MARNVALVDRVIGHHLQHDTPPEQRLMAVTPLAKFPRPSLAVEPATVLDTLSMFGLPGYQCAVGLAVFTSESFLDAYAFNVVNDPDAEHHHSIDAGYTAINFTYYWPLCVAFRPQKFPPLTSRQVFDPLCATAAAVIIFNDAGGRTNPVKGWSRWTQFRNGKYLPSRGDAIALAKTKWGAGYVNHLHSSPVDPADYLRTHKGA